MKETPSNAERSRSGERGLDGKLIVPVMVAVGAAFKFVSGKVKSAPAWIRESGFEWLWRFFHEPSRTWRRAFVYGPQFAARSILELSGLKTYE